MWERIAHREECNKGDDIREAEEEAGISDAGALSRSAVGELLAHEPDGELAAPDDGDVEEPGGNEGLAALLTFVDEVGLKQHDEALARRHEVGAVLEVVFDTADVACVAGSEPYHDDFFETKPTSDGAADDDAQECAGHADGIEYVDVVGEVDAIDGLFGSVRGRSWEMHFTVVSKSVKDIEG